MTAIPKQPADRSPSLRLLAHGEDCTVNMPAGGCDPATVVWAHTNTQVDNKGMGYKGNDSAGFFACHRCHAALDQPSGQSALSAEDRAYYIAWAQSKTTLRLQEIADSPTMRPWKVKAARWALKRRSK